jgi:hypothetical protein
MHKESANIFQASTFPVDFTHSTRQHLRSAVDLANEPGLLEITLEGIRLVP